MKKKTSPAEKQSPIDFLLEHMDTILSVWETTEGGPTAKWTAATEALPELKGAMRQNTFTTVAPAMVATLGAVKQDSRADADELLELKAKADKLQRELNTLRDDNTLARAELLKAGHELKKMQSERDSLAKELEVTLFELNTLRGEKNQKKSVRLDGWTIAFSGGYFRAFKRIKGKQHGVFLGKELDLTAARGKIKAKEQKIREAL